MAPVLPLFLFNAEIGVPVYVTFSKWRKGQGDLFEAGMGICSSNLSTEDVSVLSNLMSMSNFDKG